MTSVRCDEPSRPVQFPEYVIASGVQRMDGGYEPGNDNGLIEARFWTSLHGVVGYAKDIAADWFAAGNARNEGVRHGYRLDDRKSVCVHRLSPRLFPSHDVLSPYGENDSSNTAVLATHDDNIAHSAIAVLTSCQARKAAASTDFPRHRAKQPATHGAAT